MIAHYAKRPIFVQKIDFEKTYFEIRNFDIYKIQPTLICM